MAMLAVLASCQVADRGASAGPASYGLGTIASAADIAVMNTDASPSGEGLPRGNGDATRGAVLYQAKCAVCHGANGEGMSGSPPSPPLIGREPREGFPFGNDPKAVRTIGNYWPEAVTLFDYIKRSMPLAEPGSLTDDEVYSLTAHLLVANEILPAGAALDSAALMAVRMPAQDRFVLDDRRGGSVVR